MKKVFILLTLSFLLSAGLCWGAGEVTSLTALSEAPASGDLVEVVDVSDTTYSANGTNKKITATNLLNGISSIFTGNVGSTSTEVGDVFIADSKHIYFLNDQSLYFTPTTGLLTLTGALTITGRIKSGSYITGLMEPIVITTASGVQDGGNDQAILTDSGESFTVDSYIGMTLYNVTDGSSCTVLDNDGTTITCTLTGGTDNNWDDGDVWQVGPGPAQSGDWFYVVAASTIRHPATVGYVVCYESDAAAILTIDMASDSMIFQGTLNTAVEALSAGNAIDSSGSTTGDYMCLHNKSATEAQGKGKRGTWVDGGAS